MNNQKIIAALLSLSAVAFGLPSAFAAEDAATPIAQAGVATGAARAGAFQPRPFDLDKMRRVHECFLRGTWRSEEIQRD